ncbi:unnamed protein product, partial [marine sediment metagenome]
QMGCKIITDPETLEFEDKAHYLIDHPDGLVESIIDATEDSRDLIGNPVEAKSVERKGEWGDAGTDEIPDAAMLQVHVHMICTGREVCHVAALIGKHTFDMYRVELNTDIADAIKEAAVNFWEIHVLRDIPPYIAPSLDMLKLRKREPQKIYVFQDMAPLENWELAKKLLKEAEAAKEVAEAAMISKLSDAEAATFPDGQAFTYYEESQNRFNQKEFNAAHPEMFLEFKRQTTPKPRIQGRIQA